MKVLVTGGSGFLGKELIRRLYNEVSIDVRVLARNEGNLVALKENFPGIEIMVGDMADPFTCDRAVKDVDGIYHLAALKHVGIAENNVKQCIESNIPLALLEATRIHKPEFIIGISTDKAASRSGVYGSTKFLMERLFAEYERINPDTKYRTVRYGNVWNSSGSFITKWKPRMEKGEEIILTDPNCSRFFWTVREAVDLIFECLDNAKDATPYVPKMKAIKMGVVLEACQEVYGECPVKVIGLQPGENLNETMDGITYSNEVEHYEKGEFKVKFLTSRV